MKAVNHTLGIWQLVFCNGLVSVPNIGASYFHSRTPVFTALIQPFFESVFRLYWKLKYRHMWWSKTGFLTIFAENYRHI
jgi:hypothetical protein